MDTPPKDRFFKVYANLPIGLRDQVILVLPDIGPLTWNAELGSGDSVDVSGNPLGTSAYSDQIPALQAAGVAVSFDAPGEIIG